jgi:hypothetical protein
MEYFSYICPALIKNYIAELCARANTLTCLGSCSEFIDTFDNEIKNSRIQNYQVRMNYLSHSNETRKKEPNKSLEPTRVLVTDPAAQAPRQAPVRLI